MTKGQYIIVRNERIAPGTYRMVLEGDGSVDGEFVQVAIPGFYLRRPLSVCDKDSGHMTLIYKVVGEGTAKMAKIPAGMRLDVLTGLGNGFDLSRCGDTPLLIGGGTGLSPLYWLAKELLKRGASPTALLGFNTADEVFYADEFRALGIETIVTTADGSRGIKGFVTAAMERPHSGFYTCGPEEMLRAVCGASPAPGQLSLDRRMGCGFGACMGCTVITRSGPKRICKEGPVLDREEIIWED